MPKLTKEFYVTTEDKHITYIGATDTNDGHITALMYDYVLDDLEGILIIIEEQKK
jgi:hypothetical protein